ncbi:phosphoribosylglycinamide formyltransferase-1 [Maribacter dokdonensis]|uniref:Phosphoribosylglycinamide formyltransferase n=1 Tax=Maribacter dokdonensis TaxID=320912 RepID=A0A1H4KMB7_9FLAO|nr:phosphoribosylglycinamide formyltransferase [Maribacter dokdonensis]SDT37718.1 phosphoribosylglycinamide formyltransferase-1 [Maribacter dokdonensis]SEB59235.1 formyltetrahydrofolate-dependent phosphoribosylglycinamide formyltransferase [Maribacter dokdonensis]
MKTKKIILFASGSGSNVENIANYFKLRKDVTICCVLTNKSDAKVIERCNRLGINALFFNRQAFSKSNFILDMLRSLEPDLIVLAGFLWKIPEAITNAFPNKIINIHPALLPKYGGKGMYGMHVHNAVKEAKETETGITIHYVNAHYDEGATIQQVKTIVNPKDSPEDIASKVHLLEYEFFPKVIDELLSKQ